MKHGADGGFHGETRAAEVLKKKELKLLAAAIATQYSSAAEVLKKKELKRV